MSKNSLGSWEADTRDRLVKSGQGRSAIFVVVVKIGKLFAKTTHNLRIRNVCSQHFIAQFYLQLKIFAAIKKIKAFFFKIIFKNLCISLTQEKPCILLNIAKPN